MVQASQAKKLIRPISTNKLGTLCISVTQPTQEDVSMRMVVQGWPQANMVRAYLKNN
jgi:hypothetical protein